MEKAEGDFRSALLEYRTRKSPNYDAVCFHAQQCIEKYLKGCLEEYGISFKKKHDLVMFLDQLLPQQPLLVAYRPSFLKLNAFSINVRYPGEWADKEAAKEALTICKKARLDLRKVLGLD